jgi:predicted amidophosphoribosyltransferase
MAAHKETISHVRTVTMRVDALIAAWIGMSLPSADAVIREARWQPDEPEAYCGRCGDSTGSGEATESGCASCRESTVGSDALVRLGAYAEPLRSWVLAVKFQRWSEMGKALGAALGRRVVESGRVDVGRAMVVPMPMPWPRRWYRGIDHARVIAEAVAAEMDVPLAVALRKANGPPQVALSASERVRHGSAGLAIRRRIGGWPLEGLDIVLVDDVRTTGASIRAASRLLRPFRPARVIAAVVAVTEGPARLNQTRQ